MNSSILYTEILYHNIHFNFSVSETTIWLNVHVSMLKVFKSLKRLTYMIIR